MNKLLLLSDTLSIDEFSLFLAESSGNLETVLQFRDLILKAIKAGILTPIFCSNNNSFIPLEQRLYEFTTKDLLEWAKEKKLLEPSEVNPVQKHDQTLCHSTPLMDAQREAIKEFWLKPSQSVYRMRSKIITIYTSRLLFQIRY